MTDDTILEAYMPSFSGFSGTGWEMLLSGARAHAAHIHAQKEPDDESKLDIEDFVKIFEEVGDYGEQCSALARSYCEIFDSHLSESLGFPIGLRFQKFRPKTDLADDLILATLPLLSARKMLELSEAERHSSLEGVMPPDFGPLQWRLPERGEDSSKLIFRSLQRWDRVELCALLAAFADPLIERIALGEIAGDHARLAFADSVDWNRFDKRVEARRREKVASFLDGLVFDCE